MEQSGESRTAECAIRHSGEMAFTGSKSEDRIRRPNQKTEDVPEAIKGKPPQSFDELGGTEKDYGGLTEYG